MKLLVWLGTMLAAVVLSGAILGVLVSASDQRGGAADSAIGRVARKNAVVSATGSRAKLPRVVVEDAFHNFGILEPEQDCEHLFTIGNAGDAPLKLERGGTSCECTMSELPQQKIPPGGEAMVRVASKVQQTEGTFSHRATILTNDPERPRIDLRIAGKVASTLAVDRPRVHVASSDYQGETPLESLLVYSQVWDEFVIKDIHSTVSEADWQVEPADEQTLSEHGAKSGFAVKVQLAGGNPAGSIRVIPFDITAAPTAKPDREMRTHFDVWQKMRKRVELGGGDYQIVKGTLSLGPIDGREGGSGVVAMIVRDQLPLHVVNVESDPSFLKVRLEPLGIHNNVQTFRIHVEVPSGSPPCNYMTQPGWVRIATEHPAASVIEFKVSLAVIGQYRSS